MMLKGISIIAALLKARRFTHIAIQRYQQSYLGRKLNANEGNQWCLRRTIKQNLMPF